MIFFKVASRGGAVYIVSLTPVYMEFHKIYSISRPVYTCSRVQGFIDGKILLEFRRTDTGSFVERIRVSIGTTGKRALQKSVQQKKTLCVYK